MNIPPGYTTALGGQSKMFGEMVGGFVIAFGLSIIFMYMVLAAQFESFTHPVTIMLSLMFFHQQMSMFSILGILLLFGIVKKNSILQVDQTINLRNSGMERRKAILQANRERLRPILMTTAALVAGMIPVAFGRGAGSGEQRGIAIVVIGGQTLCLFITLLITPVAYSLFDDLETWWSRAVLRKRPNLKLIEPTYEEAPRHAVD